MPVYKGTSEISKVYKGATPLDNVQVGASELWTGVVVPTVVTNAATSVSFNLMTTNLNITSLGGGTVSSHGFYFGTNPYYANNTKTNLGGVSSTGAYTRVQYPISALTTYYFTAFAINEAGESIGATLSQQTIAIPFTATTATLDALSGVYTNYNAGPTYHIRQYHKNGYSGSIYTTLRYNTNLSMTPYSWKRLYTVGTAQNEAVTNADQIIIFWKSGGIQNFKSLALYLKATGGRAFSNASYSNPYGNGYAAGTPQNGPNVLSVTYAQDNATQNTISSVAWQFRYS